MQEQIEIDGTLVKNHTYQFTIPQLTPIQQFLRTCSFAAQDVLHGLDDSVLFLHHPSIEPSQQQFVKSVYGSAQGKYYSDSLEHFTRNCGPRVQEIVKKKLDLITGDMHSLSRLTMEALNSDTNPIADTWLGKIDVRKALEQQKAHQLFESQSKHLQQFRELGEQAQQLMIQLPATVKPGDYSSVGENDLLLENVQDLASVNALIASGKPLDPNVMERVRTRLLTLISRGPDSRIQLAPPTMMRPQPVQQNFLPNLRPVMPNMNTLLLMQQQQIAMMNMRPVMPQCMDCGTIIQVCKLRIAY
ncbi:hypothetical protein EDD86DRAFT_108945 [Gorgonomyces haynaldii]|nr:hypothetical protein EDD86DRAFT_108945 [Gorgonomyces haynaldii]